MPDKSDRSAPMIGQFSGPDNNAPRVALQRKDPEKSAGAPEASEASEAPTEAQSPPSTPEEIHKEFLEGLKEVGLTLDEARGIMDEVLTKRFYTERHELRGKPLIVRSRNYRDTLRTQQYLEAENPTYATSMDEIILRYNAAASLVQFGDRTFDHPEDRTEYTEQDVEDAFDTRLRFLQTLPSIVVGKLNTVVYNMDRKLAAVFSEGAPEDF